MSEYLNNHYNYMYSPYLDYNNALRGGGVTINYSNSASSGLSVLAQAQPQVQPNVANPITQPKHVSFGAKEETQKDGISNGAKWGIGLGLVALAGMGIYITSRGRVRNKAIKELAEHIEFKEAKTMEEAKNFAQDKFEVKLELEDNLFAANLINDVFTKISNKMKGKVKFPKKCYFNQPNSVDGRNAGAAYNYIKDAIEISKKGGLKLEGTNKYINLLDIWNKKGNNYSEIIKNLGENNEHLRELMFTIAHEEGHCMHVATCKDAVKMLNLGELKAQGVSDTHYTKDFLEEIKDNKIIKEFSRDYALTSPCEFVADVFAHKVFGKSIPKEVEEIYIKYGGPLF